MLFVWIFVPVGLYLIGLVYTFGRVASAVAWKKVNSYYGRTEPDWNDGVAIGLMNGLIWPIALPVWLALWRAKSVRQGVVSGWIFKPPPYLREVAAEHRNREREEYIKRLEQKAGVRG